MASTNELKDKICIITGATSGIGLITATALAGKGAQLILIVRNETKARDVVQQIKQETGNDQIEYLLADLSIQADIHKAAAQFKTKYTHLDILLNNAGAYFQKRIETPEGHEMTLALNHLNYFLLTNLLLDTLKASQSARIINVASGAHFAGTINFDDLAGAEKYHGWKAYCQSKLANVLFTVELAKRLKDTHITVNTLHPGFVATSFGDNNAFWVKCIAVVAKKFAISPEEGAETSIYLASSPEVAKVTGKYFYKNKPRPTSPLAQNEQIAQRLWDVSEKLTGKFTF